MVDLLFPKRATNAGNERPSISLAARIAFRTSSEILGLPIHYNLPNLEPPVKEAAALIRLSYGGMVTQEGLEPPTA